MRLSLPGMSEATPVKISPTWLPKHQLDKDGTNRHANMSRELRAGEAQEASGLDKELQATKEGREQET